MTSNGGKPSYWFAQHSRSVIFLTVTLALIGGYLAFTVPVAVFPATNFPRILIAVDNGVDRFICAGPVLSHYEFEVIGDPRRIADQEWGGGGWGSGIVDGNYPPDVPASRIEGLATPVWTQSYLVPLPRP